MNSIVSMHNAIALDIAQAIVSGKYPVGTKLSGRSLLSGRYNVSPETVRKAVAVLKQAKVLAVSQGKEAVVESVEQAYIFLSHNKDLQSIHTLKQEVEALLDEKREIDKRIEAILDEIINYSDRLKNLDPYNPLDIPIQAGSHAIGKSLAELRMQEHTGATVIAIKRGADIIISPQLSTILNTEDQIVVIAQASSLQQLTDFLSAPA